MRGKVQRLLLFLITIVVLFIPNRIKASKYRPAYLSNEILVVNDVIMENFGYKIDDYNYYRLRDLAIVFKAHNLHFDLEGDEKEIIAKLNNIYNELEEDKKIEMLAKKEGYEKTMEISILKGDKKETSKVKVYNIDGFNYFKLRDAAKLIGFHVRHDDSKDFAEISTSVSKQVFPKFLNEEDLVNVDYKIGIILEDVEIMNPYIITLNHKGEKIQDQLFGESMKLKIDDIVAITESNVMRDKYKTQTLAGEPPYIRGYVEKEKISLDSDYIKQKTNLVRIRENSTAYNDFNGKSLPDSYSGFGSILEKKDDWFKIQTFAGEEPAWYKMEDLDFNFNNLNLEDIK